MNDNISLFPNWKTANATVADRLHELLLYAQTNPSKVHNLLVLWDDDNGLRHSLECSELSLKDAVFLLEATKNDVLKRL